jgi:uncharacterized protein YjiS (DUF1127 family)
MEVTMTAITQFSKTSTAPIAQGLAAFAGIVVRRVQQFARAFKHRHDAAMLAGLDDRMLADIGLTRGDLRDAFSQPLWQDPTVILTSRVRERRVNRPRLGRSTRSEILAPSIVPAVGAHPVIDVTMYR